MPAERFQKNANATTDNKGHCVFTFETPPTGLVWFGTLNLAAATTNAFFTAKLGGAVWCTWGGTATGGPVQALPGEQLTVSADGLQPNFAYQLVWIGRSNSLNEVEPQYPEVTSGSGISQQPGTTIIVTLPTSGTPSFGQQKVSVGGTAVQLSSSSIPIQQGVAVQALKGNTDQVYLGIVGVTTTHDGTGNGWELQPGQCSPVIPVSNVNVLYINSATAGSGVVWSGV